MKTPPISYTPPELRVGDCVIPVQTGPLGSPRQYRDVELVVVPSGCLELTRTMVSRVVVFGYICVLVGFLAFQSNLVWEDTL
jgi:hypothetical protein